MIICECGFRGSLPQAQQHWLFTEVDDLEHGVLR